MKLTAASFAMLLGFGSAAQSEDVQWFANEFDNTTILAFGMPDTDFTPIVFQCDRGDEMVRFYVSHDAPEAVDGQHMTVTLSSSGGSITVDAAGQFQEIDDLFHLEGEAKLDRSLVRILSEGSTLTIGIEDQVQEIPLAGAATQIDTLIAACGAPLKPDDLEMRITNATDATVVSVLFSQRGANDFDGDTYGNEVLAPGQTTYIVIPEGRRLCDFDLMAEFDEEAERDPMMATLNLCESNEFLVGGP